MEVLSCKGFERIEVENLELVVMQIIGFQILSNRDVEGEQGVDVQCSGFVLLKHVGKRDRSWKKVEE